VKQWLESHFPELRGKVTGNNFPPPPVVELLMKLLSGIQLLGILFSLFGPSLFTVFGFSVPSWYSTLSKNGVQVAIFVYLLLPQILSKYIITGAFEIVLDGVSVYSKIETGKLPEHIDLTGPLIAAGLKYVG